jgi:gliding motility-associated-like protein
MIENLRCQLKESVYINLPVADKPVVKTTKSNDINCFIGQAKLLTGGGTRYLWQPATGLSDPFIPNPIAQISTTTTYRVFISTSDGCLVEDSITVNVTNGDDGTGFLVPGGFTPNNDGKNDCFGVGYWGQVSDFAMNVYNRWGELIFSANNPSQCWDGKYKGQLQPSDVYVYIIKAKTICGNIFRKGTVALIK